jgi:hypothetical protein
MSDIFLIPLNAQSLHPRLKRIRIDGDIHLKSTPKLSEKWGPPLEREKRDNAMR